MRRNLKLFKIFGLGAIPIIQLRESLIKDSKLTQSYLVLIVSSCLIATFGLVINSSAVIIGAMIVAPLMLPLRGLSFAALEGDIKLLRSSFTLIALGSMIAVASSCLVGLVINLPSFDSEVASRTQPNLIDLLIALVAGGTSGYAKIRPRIGDAIPGTAIAVALMPPLCVVGLTLSQGEWQLAQGATLLYITNLIGISFACLLVYVLGGYGGSNELTRKVSSGVSGFLIALLAIPLGISFWQLLAQTRLEQAIPEAISLVLRRPDLKVIDLEVIRETKPHSVILTVQARELVTPEEVAKLEQRLREQLGQPFELVFEVIPSRQVKSNNSF